MRLAQLARRISVKPSEISEFLATKNIEIENSSNAKVNDDHVALVLERFAPELLKDEQTPESIEADSTADKPEEELVNGEGDELAQAEQYSEPISEKVIEQEVIKPIKVELPGLKVVGKIDLPEPKKKEELAKDIDKEGDAKDQASTAEQPQKRPDREDRKKSRPMRDQDRRPRKNPIALQREREEREALRKKLREKEREKELRTQRYLKKVSTKVPPPKPIKRANHEDEYEVFEEAAKPKSFLGKIINWFVSN